MKAFSVEQVRYLFIVSLLTLTGCQSQNEGNVPPTQGVVEQAARVALMTPTANGATATATPTATTVLAQPTVSPTKTLPPPTTTPTPVPTLTNEQEAGVLSELLQRDDSCPLPCWWGIVPSQSLLDLVLTRLRELGFRVGSTSAGMRAADDFLVTVDFGSSDGVVTTIDVASSYDPLEEKSSTYSQAFARSWRDYSLKEMLDRYGIPSHTLLFSPYRADPGGGPTYRLYLFYDSQGIVVEYRGFAEQLQGSNYRACFDLNNVWTIQLFLYEPNTIGSIVEHILPLDSISYLGETDEVYDLIDWHQATGMSLEAFYDSLQSTGAEPCVEFYTPFP